MPEALRALGYEVRVHDDEFEPQADDAEWITAVGRRGWLILTKDQRIRHRPIERAAVLAVGARLFALTTGNQTGTEMAAVFARHAKKMADIAISEPAPFIARVSNSRVVVERLRR